MNMSDMSLQIRRLVLLVIAAVLVWKITALGFSNYTMEKVLNSEEMPGVDELTRQTSATKALQWDPTNRRALFIRAVGNIEKQPIKAEQQLLRLAREDPGNGLALVLLANLVLKNNQEQRADKIMIMATRLMPANGPVHIDAARYWWQREKPLLAIQNWSQALGIDSAYSKTIYPILLAIAENDKILPALQSIIKSPPLWWPDFFTFLAQRAIRNETVEAVYLMRRSSNNPLTMEERQAYIQRQRRDGHFARAYLSWLNGLNKEQLGQLGQLYNGSFELNISNSGYGWHMRKTRAVTMNMDYSTRDIGKRALHLHFRNREVRFNHLYQPLFLRPAHYQVRGRIRLENLNGRGGLQWVVRCTGKKSHILGKSDRFLGSSDWQKFVINFVIPKRSCVAPELRLKSTGLRTFDHKLEGSVWFDAMAIRTIAGLPGSDQDK